jgi:RimJ/RimL family protein N-acetyltransferase
MLNMSWRMQPPVMGESSEDGERFLPHAVSIELVTERLRLRPFQDADLEGFVAYRSDPEVARYQSWSPTYSMAHAELFLSSQRGLAFGEPESGCSSRSSTGPRRRSMGWRRRQ